MIFKGRSLTMRHVSRTHRVALVWLFDRTNVDPKIQIKYVGSQNQLADMLTEGNITRDGWSHLLGKEGQEKNSGGQIKAKKFERESLSHVGFGYIIQPEDLQSGLEFCFHPH